MTAMMSIKKVDAIPHLGYNAVIQLRTAMVDKRRTQRKILHIYCKCGRGHNWC